MRVLAQDLSRRVDIDTLHVHTTASVVVNGMSIMDGSMYDYEIMRIPKKPIAGCIDGDESSHPRINWWRWRIVGINAL